MLSVDFEAPTVSRAYASCLEPDLDGHPFTMSKPASIELSMVRETLDGVPSSPLEAGFTIRGYRPGDEANWTAHPDGSRTLS